MFWRVLCLAIPAVVIIAAGWGIVRRKWYGFLPIIAVAIPGWLVTDETWVAADAFLEAGTEMRTANEAMVLILASGAAVMALAALWAGWSRGWWFWRALLLAAVPASLTPLAANELVLLCLLTMPLLAAAAYIARRWQDGKFALSSHTISARPQNGRRNQFTLRNFLLAFIVLGLLATSIRSLLVGHALLVDSGLFWLAGSIIFASLAAAAPAIIQGSGRKWLVGCICFSAVAVASWWWLAGKGRRAWAEHLPFSLAISLPCSGLLAGGGDLLCGTRRTVWQRLYVPRAQERI